MSAGEPIRVRPDLRPRAWSADDEHRQAARDLAGHLGERFFAEAGDRPWRVYSGQGRTLRFELERLDEDEDVPRPPWAPDYWQQMVTLASDDPEVWPQYFVDESGRRYCLDVEVSVTPLPPLDIAFARAEEDLAMMRRYSQRMAADRERAQGDRS